jgi:tetrahydromethanopterin S-methyltransferase subunit G
MLQIGKPGESTAEEQYRVTLDNKDSNVASSQLPALISAVDGIQAKIAKLENSDVRLEQLHFAMPDCDMTQQVADLHAEVANRGAEEWTRVLQRDEEARQLELQLSGLKLQLDKKWQEVGELKAQVNETQMNWQASRQETQAFEERVGEREAALQEQLKLQEKKAEARERKLAEALAREQKKVIEMQTKLEEVERKCENVEKEVVQRIQERLEQQVNALAWEQPALTFPGFTSQGDQPTRDGPADGSNLGTRGEWTAELRTCCVCQECPVDRHSSVCSAAYCQEQASRAWQASSEFRSITVTDGGAPPEDGVIVARAKDSPGLDEMNQGDPATFFVVKSRTKKDNCKGTGVQLNPNPPLPGGYISI